MTRRRFYAPPELVDEPAQSITLPADEAKHLRDVLRLRVGDEAYVFDGAGREFRCVVRASGKGSAVLELVETVAPAQPESPLHLTLAVALLKGEKFDWVVQKATELGVTRLVPLQTARADVRLRDTTQRAKRWRRVALAAAKQSGRAVVPEIVECAAVASFIGEAQGAARFFFSECGGMNLPTGQAVSSVVAMVGPEGGWSDEEIALAQNAGWQCVTLGGRILRAETAALAIAVLLQHSFGDLR